MRFDQFLILLILIMLINSPPVNELVIRKLGDTKKQYGLIVVNVLLALAIYFLYRYKCMVCKKKKTKKSKSDEKEKKEPFFMEFGEKPECAKGYNSGKDVKFEYTYAGLHNSCANNY